MTSKERFMVVCEHRNPDRIPIDYMATAQADKKLKKYYGISSERDLLNKLGCDFYYLSVRDISQNETFLSIYRGPELDCTEAERTCPFGIRYRRTSYDWKFGADEAIRGPLQNATLPEDILKHPLPRPEWFDMEALSPECEEYADKVVICGFWTAILGNAYRMHGFENFLLNLAANEMLIKTLVDRLTDFYLELNDRLFSALKGKVQIFFMGNDFGTQNGLLFSREMWLDYYFDNYKKLIDLAHSHNLKVMAHSCGAISEILGDMIEAGVDIIDPVQTTADNMNPAALKEKFGDKIVFHGAIDTQQVLPMETPEGVYRHAVDTMHILGKHGGYIFASCNNIQSDTPVENIDAMYHAAREYKI